MYFLCDSFWQETQKRQQTVIPNPYKPDSAKNNIYGKRAKTRKKEWADKNNFLCFPISLFHCQCARATFYL